MESFLAAVTRRVTEYEGADFPADRVLTSPELLDGEDLPRDCPPVLIGVAGQDEAVPPGPAKAFAARIGAELHEYPHSEHLMREQDWLDAWSKTAEFVRRNLSLA